MFTMFQIKRNNNKEGLHSEGLKKDLHQVWAFNDLSFSKYVWQFNFSLKKLSFFL